MAAPKPPVVANEDVALPVVEPMPEIKSGTPAAASKPAALPPATQLAAKPPAAAAPSEPHAEKTPSIKFAAGVADLNDQGKSALGKVADRLKENGSWRVQLYAYAAGSEAQTSQARFLSLTRALAVRDYLVSQGVNAERVDVRVLGNKLADKGPADRVDPVVIQR
jgi:outer membrane protein OmpA-like peptidoglycan-associated protein